jgi:hypothetical protein
LARTVGAADRLGNLEQAGGRRFPFLDAERQVVRQDRVVRREVAQDVVKAAEGFEGALAVRVEDKRQGPPKLHETLRLALRLVGQQDT